MAISEAQAKAVEKYKKANYDRITLLLPKGIKEQIQATGDSLNGFINKAIEEKLNKDT